MDSRWRNLGILIIVIAIALAILFLPIFRFAPVNFGQGLSELNSIWREKGASPFMTDDNLGKISKQGINYLKTRTIEFRDRFSPNAAGDSAGLYSLSDVYLSRLDVFLAIKDSWEATNVLGLSAEEGEAGQASEFSEAGPQDDGEASQANAFPEAGLQPDDEQACAMVPAIENMHAKLKALLQKLKVSESKLALFQQNYPEFFVEAGLSSNPEKVAEIEETITTNTQLIADLKVACG